jgi:hypothetical protein
LIPDIEGNTGRRLFGGRVAVFFAKQYQSKAWIVEPEARGQRQRLDIFQAISVFYPFAF